jgi:hypothetical protein
MTQEALSPIGAVIIFRVPRQDTYEVIPSPTRRMTVWGHQRITLTSVLVKQMIV